MQVLILNGLVVTLVVLSFLVLRRAPKPPVKLDLRADGKTPTPKDFLRSVQTQSALETDGTPASAALKGKKRPVGWDNYRPRKTNVYASRSQASSAAARVEAQPAPLERRTQSAPIEKSLNIFFNWNGHTWDAYEVLDCPAGASLDLVYKAFERAKARADRETMPFLSAAYEAIVNTYTLR